MPRQLPAWKLQRTLPLVLGFSLGLCLLTGLAVYGFGENAVASRDRQWVAHTLRVLRQALRMELAATRMLERHRVFAYTADPVARDEEHAAFEEAREEARRLVELVGDNPVQRERAIDAQQALERLPAAFLAGDQPASSATDSGAFAAFRDPLHRLRAEENALLQQRSVASEHSEMRRDRVLLVGTATALILLGSFGAALWRQTRRVEKAGSVLRQLGAERHAMLDSAGQIIIGANPAGTIRIFNRAASEALGYSPEEVIGRITPARFHDAEEIAQRAQELSVALGRRIDPGFEVFVHEARQGKLDCREWTYVRRDGSKFPVELAVRAVASPDGELLGFVGVATDLTAHRASDQAIRDLNEELKQQAASLSLTNQELESFTYSVSHDLRAPLRHIAGYARMLQEDCGPRLDADALRQIDTIVASAQRMGVLIDDLLALSRLGRKPIQRESIDMQALVRDALRDVPAGDATIDIQALPDAQGDPGLLRQVWINLLSNAVKYSGPRGAAARIEVSGERLVREVRYRVRDNGVGFDMRFREKLFGVFQRLHRAEDFAGSGVGLAIVHRIVSRHGGQLDAEGRVGEGAVFEFTLPMEGARA